ncbi:MAG: MFS transporter [Chloroflexi bacterium]|nr:MFS transporter [Chloroflexota bacterium]
MAETTALPELVEGPGPAPRRKLFHGWWIVVSSVVGDLMMLGPSTYALAVFLVPITKEMGWSRSAIALAPTMRSLTGMFVGPIVGPILDRHGPRVLMAAGGIIGGATLILLSQVHAIWQFYVLFGVGFSLAMGMSSGLVTSATVAKWFIRRRGRAVALAALGISLAGVVFTPLSQVLASVLGWRLAWALIGVLVMATVTPAALLLMRRQPEDLGLRPDGDAATPSLPGHPSGARAALPEEPRWTVRQAARTPTLWLLLFASNLLGLTIATILFHQLAYFADQGFSRTLATTVATTYSLCALTAKPIWGLIIERVSVRLCAVVNAVLSAGAFVVLAYASTPALAFAYAVCAGLTTGAIPVIQNMIWPEYYGRTFLGTIRGAFAPISMLSFGLGPFVSGLLYDATGSYRAAFLAIVGAALTSALLFALARRPQQPAQDAASATIPAQ